MKKLVKLVRLNNLIYNTNRDPQVYRRVPKKPFRIQALLEGEGRAHAQVIVDGETQARCDQQITLPNTFTCEVAFDTAGSRVATLIIEKGGESFRQDLRLDVMDHAWVG
ncbi:hypothetical protein [Acidiferrobacter sp.]|jgi:hypothetical protein|uniref:hypothetical protein n=1 Tax=Acidiferrobacter sp. TaxID=1872107 RepID=UPI0026344FD4|nr:hypothetical protein [Acidiferrobacter sp.]